MMNTIQTTLVTIQPTVAIVFASGFNRKNVRIVAIKSVSEIVNAKMHNGMKTQSPGSLAAK